MDLIIRVERCSPSAEAETPIPCLYAVFIICTALSFSLNGSGVLSLAIMSEALNFSCLWIRWQFCQDRCPEGYGVSFGNGLTKQMVDFDDDSCMIPIMEGSIGMFLRLVVTRDVRI